MKNKSLNQKINLCVATWFYSGLIPSIFLRSMAGTYGSITALPLCLILLHLCWTSQLKGLLIYSTVILFVLFVGVVSIPGAQLVLGPQTDWKGKTRTTDQNQIVIDEVLGMLCACIPIIFDSRNWGWSLLSALIFFRIFDIWKFLCPPARWFDNMESPWGVMLDDVCAGMYAAFFVWIAIKCF